MGEPEDERTFGKAGDEPAQAWSAGGRPGEPQPIAGAEPPAGYAGAPWQPRPDDVGGPWPPADTDRPVAPAGGPWQQAVPDDGAVDPDRRFVIDGSWSAAPDGPGDAADVPRAGAVPGSDGDPGAAAVPAGGQPPDAVPDGPPKALKKGRRRAGRARKEPVIPPGPVLVAAGLGLLTPSGWVFKDIDLTLRPSSVAGIVGPAGTGRSCLLLALTGRMVTNTGTLTVAGHSVKDKPAAIRALTSVARIGSTIAPEPGLTVQQSINERCLVDDVDARIGRARFDEACAAMRLKFEPTSLVGSLVGDQATLLAVALACVRVSAVIVLDDLDRGVSTAVQQTMLDALLRLARTGPTIVLSTTDRIPVMGADVVLDLTPSEGAAMWHLDPAPSDRPELDPADGDDRSLPQLEAGSDSPDRPYAPDQQSADPDARWKPDYPGDSGADSGYPGEADYPGNPDYPGDATYSGAGGYPDYPYRTDYSSRSDAADRFLNSGGPDDSNQRDAPTEDPR